MSTNVHSGGRFSLQAVALIGLTVVAIAGASLVVHDLQSDASSSPPAPAKKAAASSSTATSGGMSSGMNMASGTAMGSNAVMTVRQTTLPKMQASGKTPVAMAMVPLGQADWEGMTIQARTSAPATFVLFNGTSQQLVKPTSNDSFHLMVQLSDKYTNVAIPYSSVWATIRKNGKVVFDERLWPMISRFMGPHFGNNIALPTGGLYHLTLLVSPPVAARHIEYKGLWLKPHKVNLTFRWVPKT